MPQDLNDLDAIRLQVAQTLLEHQIVVQALQAVCLIFGVVSLALTVAWIWVLRRNFQLAQALVAQQREHSNENIEREKRHSSEWIELQSRHGLELDSITKTQWREFAELVWAKQENSRG